MTIPTVCLSSPKEEVATALRDACTKVGFFYLEGHDIPQRLLDEAAQLSKKLFALPVEQKVLLSDPILQRGYTRFEEETLDPANQPSRGDTKEGFYIGDEAPLEETDAAKLHGPNVWPNPTDCQLTHDQCHAFRETMEKYRSEANRVCMQLVGCFAPAVDSNDPHLFDQYFTEPKTSLRLLHYSAEQSDEKNGLYACGAHSDYGMITLLLTDENPGLQVKMDDGSWIDIPPKRGAFVVNIGDMFERWTNKRFKSTRHRVITPKGANERYSVPFFFEPNFDALVECLESCCSDDNPPKYPPITAGQHLLNMYEKTHADFDYLGEKKE
mmetsp:Transcript_8179/g.14834  ORF Transcript_8179/g.14834 Transcript_8179/m.14834 type:complete len:326 (-) Transcript_8179:164-1141(-)|eukprot:CAMPEP_0201895126 /NCGR_PEP_ID=MMETSP0902-20130614/42073_1 /ASSEMBLY_ACC=CAM_ASM_000551 /TAXON_ID=420261 /ORGANISM="Thalassiosira antarctica, Strain CCMP982" /LENGTH=325 /DNA_ID=CAMNT_0048427371 /DNA_START=35 /DNA_END=1012 /DNA_ORIENTATION=+